MYFTGSTLRTKLEASLRMFTERLAAAQEAISCVKAHVDSVNEIDARKAMESFVNKWIEELCKDANIQSNNTTHLVITKDDLSEPFVHFRYPHEHRPWLLNATSLETLALSLLDTEALAAQLNQLTADIRLSAFKHAATTLKDAFHLGETNFYGTGPLHIKRIKGRYELERAHYGRSHDRARECYSLAQCAETMEKETGTNGLRACLLELSKKEAELSYFQEIPSRTRFGEDLPVSAVYFNNVEKFYFDSEQLAALIGFIKTYSPYQLRTIETH